jgi:hypothetical protein
VAEREGFDGENLTFRIEKHVEKHVVISVKRPQNEASIDSDTSFIGCRSFEGVYRMGITPAA